MWIWRHCDWKTYPETLMRNMETGQFGCTPFSTHTANDLCCTISLRSLLYLVLIAHPHRRIGLQLASLTFPGVIGNCVQNVLVKVFVFAFVLNVQFFGLFVFLTISCSFSTHNTVPYHEHHTRIGEFLFIIMDRCSQNKPFRKSVGRMFGQF